MLRSMYSAISGLRNNQSKLDVIGNNISNVNTHGFKKSRTVFKDIISQSIGSDSGASATRGGVNPKQIGLGSTMATIDVIHTGGALQSTARTLDLAISGDGFFVVGDYNGGTSELDSFLYTRAGNFYMDAQGYLVDGEGRYLVGDRIEEDPNNPGNIITTQNARIHIPTSAKSMSIGQDGTVSYENDSGDLITAGQIYLAKFANTGGLRKEGSNYYQETNNSGTPEIGLPTEDGKGSIQSGFLEMSNVDLSEEFTELIVAQRGFQANARTITTSDQILEELVNLKR